MQSQEELHFTLDQLKESTPKGMSKTPKSKKKTWGGEEAVGILLTPGSG